MATRNLTTPARAGERTRVPCAAIYARPMPLLGEGDDLDIAEGWPSISADRPDTAHVRAPRFIDLTGELVSALFLIAGGVCAYGLVHVA